MLDWDKIIDSDVKQALNSFGFPPTLRAMHYRLYSLKVIPNTRSSYVSLSNNTARARESGILPIDCFSDDTRQVIGNFPSDFDYEEPETHVNRVVNVLRDFPAYYKNRVSRWHNQPHHVEIWTEKKAMIRSFEYILKNREILIIPFGGYTSVTYHYDNCQRLKKIQDELKKKIHILYFGDVDPSGEDIQRDIEDKLKQYGVSNIDFKRIALTEDQITEFKLPEALDAKTLEKLNNDTRSNGFKSDHNGKLFQVEVDALTAYAEPQFEKIVRTAVDQYFDEDIYEESLGEHSPKQLHGLVNERLQDLCVSLQNSLERDEEEEDN